MDARDDPEARTGSAEIVVRRGVDDEAEARELAAVHIAAWKWAYRGLMPDGYLARLDEQLERRVALWRTWLGADKTRYAVWVAVEGSAIVGFVSTGPSVTPDAGSSEAQLYSIYLLERVAGRGVGQALMTTAASELRRQGYASCMLWVLESNERARRFYEREGWATDGGRQVDSSPGFDLIEIRYRITL